jgi:hypothetical protein
MVAVVLEVTGTVGSVAVPLVLPAGMVTLSGLAAAELLLICTTAPPVGAGADMVTVALEFTPPVTVDGLRLIPVMVTGCTVSFAVADDFSYDAVMVADVVAVMVADVWTVNDAVVWPALTVTEDGVFAAEVLLVRLTVTPFEGAAREMVTVPETVAPPSTEVGLRVRPVTVAAAGTYR